MQTTSAKQFPYGFSIVFDGGSRGNPGKGYGSYVIRGPGVQSKKPRRLSFGRKTNNQAEYLALIAALQEFEKLLCRRGLDPAKVQLMIQGDSKLVLSQVSGDWKARDARMRSMRDQVLALINPLGSVRLEHQPRKKSVEILGH